MAAAECFCFYVASMYRYVCVLSDTRRSRRSLCCVSSMSEKGVGVGVGVTRCGQLEEEEK